MTAAVNRYPIIAAVLATALGAVGEARSEPPGSEAISTAAPGAGLSDNPVSDIPLASLSAMRERPIFSPSRRPSPSPTAPGEDGAAHARRETGPPPLTLLGTVTGADAQMALFLDERSQSVVRRRPGEAEAGWILKSIEARTVTFERDSHEYVVTLRHDTAAIEPPKPAPPGGSGTAAARARKAKRQGS